MPGIGRRFFSVRATATGKAQRAQKTPASLGHEIRQAASPPMGTPLHSLTLHEFAVLGRMCRAERGLRAIGLWAMSLNDILGFGRRLIIRRVETAFLTAHWHSWLRKESTREELNLRPRKDNAEKGSRRSFQRSRWGSIPRPSLRRLLIFCSRIATTNYSAPPFLPRPFCPTPNNVCPHDSARHRSIRLSNNAPRASPHHQTGSCRVDEQPRLDGTQFR